MKKINAIHQVYKEKPWYQGWLEQRRKRDSKPVRASLTEQDIVLFIEERRHNEEAFKHDRQNDLSSISTVFE